MRTIFISGPESTGKTTLVHSLAQHLDLPFKMEYARHFFEWHPQKLPADSKLIRHLYASQMRIWKSAMLEAQKSGAEALLLDTCPLNYYIWHSWQFGESWSKPLLDLQQWEGQMLVVLCTPDLPWVSDGQRNNEANLQALFEQFEKGWNSLSVPRIVVHGTGEERFLRCRESVSRFLGSR